MKLLLFLVWPFALFISFSTLAQEIGTFKQIDLQGGRAVLKLKASEIEVGTKVVVSFEDKTQCFLPVLSQKNELATVDISKCSSADKIKVDQTAEKSLIEESANDSEALAQDGQKITPASPAPSERIRNKESWYTLWGIGLSSSSFEDNVEKEIDELESDSSVNHYGLGLDLLGFYWPVNNHRTMVGVVVNAVSDIWDGPNGTFTIAQYLLGLSTHHFLSDEIGRGWFLRGDIGMAWYRSELDSITLDAAESSDKGIGVIAGAGYAFPVSPEMSVLFSGVFAHRKAEDSTVNSFSLLASLLF